MEKLIKVLIVVIAVLMFFALSIMVVSQLL